MEQHYSNSFLTSLHLLVIPITINAGIPSVYQKIGISINYISGLSQPDFLWIDWVKSNSTLLTFIVSLLVFLLGVRNLPELKQLLYKWTTKQFRQYLSNALLNNKLFDDCLKTSLDNLKTNNSQNQGLPKSFRDSINHALTDKEDHIFYHILNKSFHILANHKIKEMEDPIFVDTSDKINDYLGNKYLKTIDFKNTIAGLFATETDRKIQETIEKAKENIKKDIKKELIVYMDDQIQKIVTEKVENRSR